MSMNNEFKQFREITENRNGSVVAGMIASFNAGTTAASFHGAGKCCWVRLLNICLRIGIKILEQPFMINPGISSGLRDLEGFGLLMALQASA
jgi:hypothetical protein